MTASGMDSLETQLMGAVRDGKVEVVQSLLDKGVNVNYVPTKGKSALSTAAALGNVRMIQVLLSAGKGEGKPNQEDFSRRILVGSKKSTSFEDDKENQNDCYTSAKHFSSKECKQNLGYYIFVHNDESACTERIKDSNVNKNENLDAETPEGMEGLEWDVEVEGVEEEDSDDVWSNQYRWYADILDKTGGIVEDSHRECDLNLQDYTGRCAIHYAVEYYQVEVINCLISAGCRPDVGDIDNLTPLHLAAMRDYQDIAKLLISVGANVNRKTTDKMAPLHYAAVRGFVEMVALLIEGGAAIDALDANDRTPLMLAVTRNHFDVVEFLITHGAKVNTEEIHGYTALCEAVWNKSIEVASLLQKYGAKLTQSQYLLHYTVLHRHTAMAELLLKHGAYVNLRDDHGDTPLGLAVSSGHLETIRLLLEYDANPNYANSLTNVTPLLKALDMGHVHSVYEEIVRLLCQYNADLDMTAGGTMATPLTFALISRQLNCAITLIKAGADVNKYFDEQNLFKPKMQSNLDLAIVQRADDVVHLLVAAGFDLSAYKVDFPKDFSTIDASSIKGWLTLMKFNPRRLDDLCRLKIRSQMRNKALQMVPLLEIPQILKKFLLFEDIYVKKHTPPDVFKRHMSNF